MKVFLNYLCYIWETVLEDVSVDQCNPTSFHKVCIPIYSLALLPNLIGFPGSLLFILILIVLKKYASKS